MIYEITINENNVKDKQKQEKKLKKGKKHLVQINNITSQETLHNVKNKEKIKILSNLQ